jgi:DNA polymerase sigma
LTLVLKNFMYSRSLNDPYTGGLGSYSIVLMVVALLQSTTLDKKHPHSLGRLLLEFLNFYGYQMDYICKSILLYHPKFKELPTYNVFPLPNTQVKLRLI